VYGEAHHEVDRFRIGELTIEVCPERIRICGASSKTINAAGPPGSSEILYRRRLLTLDFRVENLCLF
jgi:hypothetical protein